MRSVLRIFILLTLCIVAGCGHVKSWERGNLARPEMAFTQDSLEKKIQDHINHSKEGASSVVAGSGGGCGCN